MKQLARGAPVKLIAAIVLLHIGIMWWAGVPFPVAAASMAAGYVLAAMSITAFMRVPVLRRWVGIPDCRRVGCSGPGLGDATMCPRHQPKQAVS